MTEIVFTPETAKATMEFLRRAWFALHPDEDPQLHPAAGPAGEREWRSG